jgi:Na+-translocating ferredoxin:NAD+ oxidoreductase RnfG subunit
MSDRNPGQTFIMLVVLALLALALSWLWQAMTASTTHQHANELAEQWIHEVFPPEEARTAHVSCQATDSDDNGYVSCTLNMTRNGEEQLIPIECHAYVMVNFGDTCRPLVPLTMGVRR